MTFIILAAGIVFFGLAFLITEKNVGYLLGAHNIGSAEVGNSFRVKPYLRFFRLFHIFLGLSVIILGLLVRSGFGASVAGAFLSFYIMLAYSFLIYDSHRFVSEKKVKRNKVAGTILITTTALLAGLFIWSARSSKIELHTDRLEITGIFGVEIRYDEISSLNILDEMPTIRSRNKGFSAYKIQKGVFETTENQTVRLFTDGNEGPYLHFTLKDGYPVYYVSTSADEAALYEQISEKLKN